jgi:hypothetical protein
MQPASSPRPVSTLRDLLGDRARLGVPEPCP